MDRCGRERYDGTDCLRPAWFGASVSRIGGAVGSSLEDQEAIRNAAPGQRQQGRLQCVDADEDDTSERPDPDDDGGARYSDGRDGGSGSGGTGGETRGG
ncbi:hypothetical protein [Streptomyces sp. NPDC002088]|uniref:hypothetical protein n=1 Tax=Streptomyces sp. NPDC002088 TaxID=3154665 RepID=UPI00332A5D63